MISEIEKSARWLMMDGGQVNACHQQVCRPTSTSPYDANNAS
jgi:hypothetical protein